MVTYLITIQKDTYPFFLILVKKKKKKSEKETNNLARRQDKRDKKIKVIGKDRTQYSIRMDPTVKNY